MFSSSKLLCSLSIHSAKTVFSFCKPFTCYRNIWIFFYLFYLVSKCVCNNIKWTILIISIYNPLYQKQVVKLFQTIIALQYSPVILFSTHAKRERNIIYPLSFKYSSWFITSHHIIPKCAPLIYDTALHNISKYGY